MLKFNYRHLASTMTLVTAFSVSSTYGATLLEVPSSGPKTLSLTQYWSDNQGQTAHLLKAKLHALNNSQKAFNYSDAKNTDNYDTRTTDIFKALVLKK